MKIQLFFFFSSPRVAYMTQYVCLLQSTFAHVLLFCATVHALQATILFQFLCMCAIFFSCRGHTPLPNPPPIRNYKLQVGSYAVGRGRKAFDLLAEGRLFFLFVRQGKKAFLYLSVGLCIFFVLFFCLILLNTCHHK